MNNIEIDTTEEVLPRNWDSIKCIFCGEDHLTFLGFLKNSLTKDETKKYYFHCKKCHNSFFLTEEQFKEALGQAKKNKVIQETNSTQDDIAQKLDVIISLLRKILLDDEIKKKLEFLIEKEYSNRNKLKRTLTEDSNCVRD